MRIGLFSEAYKPYVSGVVNSIDMLKLGLEDLGHEVFVITVKLPNHPIDDIDEQNVIIYSGKTYPLKSFRIYSYTKGISKKIKELKKYNFDIIHVHTEFSIGMIGMKYAKKYNVPCVATYHTNYEDYFHYFTTKCKKIRNVILYSLLKKLIKKTKSYSQCYIVPTAKIESVFKKYNFNFPVEIIPSGIDLERFKKENQDINRITEIKNKYELNNKFVYCFIGRMSPEKSIDILLNAFAQSENDNAVFLICGDGPVSNSLKDLAKKLQIENKVKFTGDISYKDIGLYYNCCDVFLNASTTETQGLTYIEALASSLPLIIKEDEATIDLLSDNGYYFNTTEELIEKMNLLSNDKVLLNKLKENATKSIEIYSKEVYAKKIETIYKRLIDKE